MRSQRKTATTLESRHVPVSAAAATSPTPPRALRERVVGATAIASAAAVLIDNVVGESWTYFYTGPPFVLGLVLELILLAVILRSAWTWPRRTASPATPAASLDSEPHRTPQQA